MSGMGTLRVDELQRTCMLTSPKIAFNSVLLPAPLGPISAVNSPQCMCRFTSFNISVFPLTTPKPSILVQHKLPLQQIPREQS